MSKSIYEEALRAKENPYRTTFEDIGTTEALQEAIEKVNKYDELMTPKKVKVYSFVNAKGKHIEEYHCGSCNHYIDRIKYENHCFNCGQKIDWSLENE
ncbi:MAG TPA: hypothetical protein GX712_05610 [Bacteroidales bacterium]|nr:hypothetical protein [Bacteroidales bacterium]